MDSRHDADMTVPASPTGALERRRPMSHFPLGESLTGQKQTGPIYTIVKLSHRLGPLQEEHDLSSKVEADLE